MTYAVIYHSQTGNTRKIAEEIYRNIPTEDKSLYEMKDLQTVPEADVYFIGFSVRNRTCGIETMNCLDKVKGGKVALFATCGFYPAEQYQKQLEHNMMVWLPENAAYLGMYLCQGKISESQANKLKQTMPEAEGHLEQMFQEGACHPDMSDLANAAQFVAKIREQIEDNTIVQTM